MPTSNTRPPEQIRVNGKLYRLAGKNSNIGKEDIKESITRAADRAALENILKNIAVHGGEMSTLAAQILENVDDKSVRKLVETISEHASIINLFLAELPKTYANFTRKHGE